MLPAIVKTDNPKTMTTEFGKIKPVDIKTIWRNEPQNFTPWLGDNLNVLGELIGLDLDLISREADSGDFSLDLLAKDLSTNRTVVIENQYNSTDHKHLGQLITYASYHKAGVIIWLAEEVREEHRAAIDWLNNNTGENIDFFAVEIDVIQIDDSKPALNFKLKAYPNEWQKSSIHTATGDTSPTMNSYKTFFQTLIDELRTKHKFTNAKAGQPQSWYAFTTGVKGFQYGLSFAKGEKVRVDLYIDTGKAEENKAILKALESEKELIEKEYGMKLEWELLENKRASRVAIYRPGSIDEDTQTLSEIKDWSIQQLLNFKKTFGKRLNNLLENKQLLVTQGLQ